MPWMPVNSDDNKGGDMATVVLVAVGISVMLWFGMPWMRSFLYCFPAAIVVALGLRYWYKRRSVDLIQLGYKDKPRQDERA